MTDLTIQIESQEVTNELNRLRHAVTNMQPAMRSIGAAIKSNIELGFRDQKSPDGIHWDALKPSTIANRRQGSSVPLNDTGVLKNSFTYIATNDQVQIGTNAKQAALMNFGGTKARFPNLWGDVPARPFMPTSQLPTSWERDVINAIRAHLEP
jgi:phage virion morphogenesis protein